MTKADLKHWLGVNRRMLIEPHSLNQTYILRVYTHPMKTQPGWHRTRKVFESDDRAKVITKVITKFEECCGMVDGHVMCTVSVYELDGVYYDFYADIDESQRSEAEGTDITFSEWVTPAVSENQPELAQGTNQ